ncbi:DoxX family protein [Paenibacillus qinlingensis]|uniref:DoxX family protein n=1 Tax=Paenibacillus qinlingensis TaxID=1837343 RepID=UPI00156650D8|nr:DoxX family protein [Paenibacillus qinlingensis]NQX62135.1 DoxX family protein [Paenibacillus qinlingensis]
MAPFVALLSSFLLFRAMGFLGWSFFDQWHTSLQGAVAVMFLLTASAHWGKRRPDLIRMVPPAFPKPASIVTITGYLEIAGAIGILIPAVSQAASVGLLLLLLAMFPANVFAARKKLTIGGKPVPRLAVRVVLQLVFIGAVVLASPWFGV